MVALNNPITQADFDALALLANTKLLPLVNASIATGTGPWNGSQWTFDDGGSFGVLLTGFTGVNTYDIPTTSTVAGSPSGILNPQPAYVFDLTKKNWRSELNRMRGDYYTLLKYNVPGAATIFQNLNSIVSGPWIVEINDPVTYPRYYGPGGSNYLDYPMAGIFSGSVIGQPCWFAELKFIYARDDAPGGVTIDTVRHADDFVLRDTPSDPSNGVAYVYRGLVGNTVTLTYNAAAPGQFKAVLKYPFSGASLPAASVFAPTATPGTGVTFTTEVNTLQEFPGDYNLVVTIDAALAGAGTIVLSTTNAVGYTAQGNGAKGYYGRGNLVFASVAGQGAETQGIHPTSALMIVQTEPQPAGDFMLNGSATIAAWILSDVNLQGVWQAKTLPVPGQNVFLDQDMPPFVNQLFSSAGSPQYTVAIGPGNNIPPPYFALSTYPVGGYVCSSGSLWKSLQNGNSGNTPVEGAWWTKVATADVYNYGWQVVSSSMRAPTLGDEAADKFSPLKSSLAARPTPYQVLRSTDFVPWDYGYSVGCSFGNTSFDQTAPGSGALFQDFIDVPADTTNIKMRCRQKGARAGWKNGVFQYGEEFPMISVTALTLVDGGSGFLLNDVVVMAGGTVAVGAQPCSIQVTAVDFSGKIVSFVKLNPGSYAQAPATPNTPISGGGGHGTGATFNLTFAGVGVFRIYVRYAAEPSETLYDFYVDSNDLTIDPDGGGSYLAGVLNDYFYFAIKNNSGVDVDFDLIVEVDTVASPSATLPPARQYFPVARECFSYCLLDVPGNLINPYSVSGNQVTGTYGKPIPQSGYCIFKLRATRLPVLNSAGISVTPASGPQDIAITVGQNVRQPDGTLKFVPLQMPAPGGVGMGDPGLGMGDPDMGMGGPPPAWSTAVFTIPAGARDSGDVAVFWPVLGGNELVYQCDEQIILEAWVNWQPVFFNATLGHGLKWFADNYANAPFPTQLQSALSFVNMFYTGQAGYPQTTTERPSPWNQNVAQVQFPLSIEIYNDLEQCLNLIP